MEIPSCVFTVLPLRRKWAQRTADSISRRRKKDEERKEPEEAYSAKEDEPKYQNVPSSGSSHILYADCTDLLFDSLVRNRHGQANR